MDPAEERRDMKKHKDFVDWLEFCADSEYGISRLCPCGGRITQEVYEKEEHDTCPGKRFFTCAKFKADGLHIRQPWVLGVSEEVESLTRRVEDAERVVHNMPDILKKMEPLQEEVNSLKSEVDYLSGQVSLLEKICFD